MYKILLFLFCLIPLFLDRSEQSFYEPYNYFLFFIFHIISVIKNKKSFFYPSSLFIIYTSLNYTFGSYLYNLNLFDDYLNSLLDDNLLAKRIIINNFFLFFTIIFSNYRFKINNNFFNKIKLKFNNSKIIFIYGIFLLFFFSLVDFNLDSFGGQGSLSNIPKSIGAIILFIYASKTKNPYKYIIYITVFFIVSVVSYEDKREAILLREAMVTLLKLMIQKIFLNYFLTFLYMFHLIFF